MSNERVDNAIAALKECGKTVDANIKEIAALKVKAEDLYLKIATANGS